MTLDSAVGLTIFSCPKPFEGHIGDIQYNAINSWARLTKDVEVILLGEDEGVPEIAEDLGLQHVPEIKTNENGTPLVGSIFEAAENAASSERLCYVNADIITPPNFVDAIESAWAVHEDSLVLGRRWNVDLTGRLDFDSRWYDRVAHIRRTRGERAPHDAIDYFAFPRGAFGEILPFAIGRFGWDNWLLHQAKTTGHALVDISSETQVVHQNHDYGSDPDGVRDDEFAENMSLIADQTDADDIARYKMLYTLSDVDYIFKDGRLRRNLSPYKAWRRLVALSHDHAALRPIVRGAKMVRQLTRS